AWRASSPLRACVTSKPCRASTADSAAATWLSSSTRRSLTPAPFYPSDLLSEYAVKRYKDAGARARAHRAVMLMDEDGVKRVPVAPEFRYAADTPPGLKCYDTCPIAIGS